MTTSKSPATESRPDLTVDETINRIQMIVRERGYGAVWEDTINAAVYYLMSLQSESTGACECYANAPQCAEEACRVAGVCQRPSSRSAAGTMSEAELWKSRFYTLLKLFEDDQASAPSSEGVAIGQIPSELLARISKHLFNGGPSAQRAYMELNEVLKSAESATARPLAEELLEATSIGMATIIARVGVPAELSPYMKRQWKRLSDLHKIACDNGGGPNEAISPADRKADDQT